MASFCAGGSRVLEHQPDRCKLDSDCKIALPPTDACCPRSGRPVAMTTNHEVAPLPEKTCSQEEVVRCPPPVAQDLWPDAVCKDHACVTQQHVTSRFDTSPFSRACARDADCTLVESDPCNPCRCETDRGCRREQPRRSGRTA